jgi:predicted Zn-dependent protease
VVAILERQFPADAGVAYVRALYAQQAGNNELALEAVQTVLDREPGPANSVLLLGELQVAEGYIERALSNLSRFHEAQPRSVKGRKLLATAFMENQQPDRAVELLKPLIGDVSKDTEIVSILVSAYGQLSDRPENPGSQGAAGEAGVEEGAAGEGRARENAVDIQEAISRLRSSKTAKAKPMSGEVLLALALLRSGQTDAAFEVTGSLLAEEPQNARLHYLYGRIMEQRGDLAAARTYYDQALEMDAGFYPAELALPPLVMQEGSHPAVIERLERARRNRATALAPRLMLADAYLLQGNIDKALEVSREIAALAPDYPLGQYLLGNALILSGDAEAGVPMLEWLEESRGGGQRARWRLVEAYERIADSAALQARLYDILAAEQQNLPALVKLALLERENGNPQSALELAKRLKKHYPDLSFGYFIHAQLALDEGNFRLSEELLDTAIQLSGESITVSRWYMVLRGDIGGDRIDQLLLDDLVANAAVDAPGVGATDWARRENAQEREFEQYRWLIGSEPDNIPLLMLLAGAYRAAGDPREIEIMREVVRLAPRDGRFRYELAVALTANGAPAQARRILQELLASRVLFEEQAAARSLLNQLRE